MITAKEIRAQRARFLNEEVYDMYRFHLVTCPNCKAIHKLDNKTTDIICWVCNTVQSSDKYEDLFI